MKKPKEIASCSPDTATELYRQLEYYRNMMPFCIGFSEKQYASTQEAKNVDAVLAVYRNEIGIKESSKPSP